MPQPDRGGFRQLGEREIYAGHLLRVVQGRFVDPEGVPFERDILRHPGAVGVVAVEGNEVILVRQYRPVMDQFLLEIPAGTMDHAGEAPIATAERELAEEAGALATHLEPLVSYWVAPGVSDERMHLFLATGLTFGPRQADGPEEHHMRVERVRLAEALGWIAEGQIADAKTIVGLLVAAPHVGL